jgi:hypothetical protein
VAHILLLLIAALTLAGRTCAQLAPVEARIAAASGSALLLDGTQPPSAAKQGDVLQPGEEIDTLGGGRITIELSDGSLVVVHPGSRILLKDFRTATTLRELFDVFVGRVRVKINHFGGRPNPYRINSPTASIAVRGTEFSVAVDPSGETEVIVYDGLVEVASRADPENKVLVRPGRGVIVRPNQPIYFFAPNPGGEIGGLGGGQDFSLSAPDAPQSSAGIYDRLVENLVEEQRSPLFLRYTAFPDSFLDGLENPAYATEFSAPEGRLFLSPSFRGSQNRGVDASGLIPDSGQSMDYSLSPQVSYFTPLPDHRTNVGVGVAAFRSAVQSVKLADGAILSDALFPSGTIGTRASVASTTTSYLSTNLVVARAFGEDRKTSLGLGLEHLKGWASILDSDAQQDSLEQKATEVTDSRSHLAQTRIKIGVTHDFSGERKVGIHYSYGFISAGFGDRSHKLNGQLQSPDTTHSTGRSSEVVVRFRGGLTQRSFYGLQASWFMQTLYDQWNLSAIPDSMERDRTMGSSFSFGLGYALHPRIVFSLDLAAGFSATATTRTEDATGNLLEHSQRHNPFLSAHGAVQADLWRNLFASTSLLTVRESLTSELALYPDSSGRLLTTDGIFAPNGLTQERYTNYYSEFGAGWHFTKNFLAEYAFSTDYGRTTPSHLVLFRFDFGAPEH